MLTVQEFQAFPTAVSKGQYETLTFGSLYVANVTVLAAPLPEVREPVVKMVAPEAAEMMTPHDLAWSALERLAQSDYMDSLVLSSVPNVEDELRLRLESDNPAALRRLVANKRLLRGLVSDTAGEVKRRTTLSLVCKRKQLPEFCQAMRSTELFAAQGVIGPDEATLQFTVGHGSENLEEEVHSDLAKLAAANCRSHYSSSLLLKTLSTKEMPVNRLKGL